MQAASQSVGGTTIVLVVLGLVEAAIVLVTLANVQVPFIGSPRVALIALLVIGMAMCSLGMEIPKYGWSNPFTVLAATLHGWDCTCGTCSFCLSSACSSIRSSAGSALDWASAC